MAPGERSWKDLMVSLFAGKKKKPKTPTVEQRASEPRAPEGNGRGQNAQPPSVSRPAYPLAQQQQQQQQQEAAVGTGTLPINTPMPRRGPTSEFPVQGLPPPHLQRRYGTWPQLPPAHSPPSWRKRPVGPFKNPIPMMFPGMPSWLRPEDPEFGDWLAEHFWLDHEGRLLSESERERMLEWMRREEAGEAIEDEEKEEEVGKGKGKEEEKEKEEKEGEGKGKEGDWEDVEDEEE